MKRFLSTSTLFCLLLAAVTLPVAAADILEGRWESERDHGREWIQLTYKDKRNRSQMSISVDSGTLVDLADGSKELRREAGTIRLEGRNSGTFQFTANPQFARELKNRGYEDQETRHLYQFAVLDLTLAFIDEMKSLGYGESLRRIEEFKIHGVSGEYIRDLQGLGLGELSGRQLVEMKIHGVDPEMVRAFVDMGLEDLSARRLVELQIHGVDPDYIRDLAAVNIEGLTSRQLVEMKIHDVDPDDVREFAEVGVAELSARKLVEMQIHGVSPRFVREMAELGYNDLSSRQLVEMKIHGVSPSFVRRLEEKGYKDLNARRLVEMKIHGLPGD